MEKNSTPQEHISPVAGSEPAVSSAAAGDTKGVYIQTFGCQMNVHDSRKITTFLSDQGYHSVETADDADVILVNTCSVREKPEQKVMSAVGVFAPLKEKNPDLVIGIGGCFARQEGDQLLKRSGLIDLVFGPDNIPELPTLINRVQDEKAPVVEVDFDSANNVRFLDIRPLHTAKRYSAMVTIMKGCDKYCSFCIVPYVRGRERYRPAEEIIDEVKRLCASGMKEILLLGQSVTSYRWTDGEEVWTLARLLKAIDGTPGLDRLRFTSPYPRDFTPELIDCFDGRVKTLCEHVHLPFQSGANDILYRMNRRHTREQYFEWVDALRERCPSIALSADVIVGFPGETDEHFEDTMDLIERVRFDQLFSFMYSPRPNTPARRKEQIPDDVKKERLHRLQSRQSEISWELNKELEGSIQPVLVEGPSRKGNGQLKGRTSSNKVVNFLAPESLCGQMVEVKITRGLPHSLAGELVTS
jgi:tRNA-2-methylthio-N6-dimethylallyladenosine synthase